MPEETNAPKVVPDAPEAKVEPATSTSPAAAAAVAHAEGRDVAAASVEAAEAPGATGRAPLASDLPPNIPVPPADAAGSIAKIGDTVVPQQTDPAANRNLPTAVPTVVPGITPASPRNMPAMSSPELMDLATHPSPTSPTAAMVSESAAAVVSGGHANHTMMRETARAADGDLALRQEETRAVLDDAQKREEAARKPAPPANGATPQPPVGVPAAPVVAAQPPLTAVPVPAESAPGGVPGL